MWGGGRESGKGRKWSARPLSTHLDESHGLMGYGGELEAGRRIGTMVRGYLRYCHLSYLATFVLFCLALLTVLLCAGLEVRQQSDS